MTRSRLWLTGLVLLAAGGLARADEPRAALRRFALVIGANDGGKDRVKLRYATSDAKDFGRILEELGGVARGDAFVVLDPDRDELRAALDQVARAIDAAKPAGQRLELVLYYSGHSDGEGLLLRGDRFGYDELRRALTRFSTDVRVAILDSCSSGALTRQKGGVRRAPFLMDGAAAVRGHAFLTSSSEHEAAQESDRLQASYFTHFLVSGLRGAADASGDGRVTLNEAYQYAFDETLRQTEKTQAGPQHPAYDIQLQGTGDLVMTDLRATSASLVLAPELQGRFFVHDSDERLAAELYKPAGRGIELGLAPGAYTVRLDRKDELFEASVNLAEGQHLTLGAKQMEKVSRELTALRGGAPGPAREPSTSTSTTDQGSPEGAAGPGASSTPTDAADREEAALEADLAHGREQTAAVMPPSRGRYGVLRTPTGDEYLVVPFAFSVLPGVSSAPNNVLKNLSLNLIAGRTARIHGIEVGLGYNKVDEEMRGGQFVLGLNEVDGDLIGFQAASGANIVRGRALAFQSASGFNVLGGGRAVQGAGLFNTTRGDLEGVQLAGLFNNLGGPSRAVQAAGVFNIAEETLTGVQASGVFNITRGFHSGVQLAGVVNYAGGVKGVQAAVLNIGGDVSGTQLGVINIAHDVDGAQLGLINIANDSDVSVGLVNVVRKGQLHLDAWTSTDESLGAAVRFGSRHFYTLVWGASMRRDDLRRTSSDDMFVGLGLGGHITMGRLFVDIDTMAGGSPSNWDKRDRSANLFRARLAVGYQVAPHFAVFGGFTANTLITYCSATTACEAWRKTLPELPAYGGKSDVRQEGNLEFRSWPGVVIGAQI